MAVSSLSLNFVSKPFTHNLGVRGWISPDECAAVSITKCSKIASFDEESINRWAQCAASGNCKRRALILGMGALTMNTLQPSPLLAEEIPEKYNIYVDKVDGYSYYYPSDWRDFDFIGHDSAFKDKSLQLQNVRLSFLPTTKTDIRELGPMDEVIFHLTNDVYSAPNQIADILDMQEKTINGRNYWTFEYVLTSPNFSRAAFATIAIGNGRYYTLIVGANQRRWRKYRNMLKVVADSFKVMDI
ncbi:photosynthetic NDH subunit of lumenal location 1, chloroplastic-like isoform X1 [Salvia splendens]|nr:photosynthetic NDH subunit of lumenal location 1, chloroplastic-like isoform X1 [Salvia splendens]